MNEDIPSHVIQLAEHCLKNTYFRYDGQLYRQTDGAPMGSSLSPAIGNLFMAYFEAQAIRESQLKPKLWIRYVDDIFILWSHGEAKLDHFLTYFNSLHDRIEFTIEKEKDKQLPFLDVLLTRSDGRKLQHQVYRKPTRTDRYLNAQSHHHPSQIQAVANTLICRSVRLTDEIHNKQEMEKITRTLRDNNYTESTIRNAKRTNTRTRRDSTKEQEREDIPSTTLPYVKGVTDQIGRILKRHHIRTTYKPHKTVGQLIGNPKDPSHLENQGVYLIPCRDCPKYYIGQTNRKISARIEEHKLAVSNKQIARKKMRLHHSCAIN
ncbi:uncharacterized protein LOC132696254 [Cylas formicarius]|uniref:uncharacterized protein LOC132696254 n=1 Tax=Cylas formicarius TaxID=197179 RepID=UPI002958B6CE|nr:uncharacterized protein LOC132696254 [Cylas formicarius]